METDYIPHFLKVLSHFSNIRKLIQIVSIFLILPHSTKDHIELMIFTNMSQVSKYFQNFDVTVAVINKTGWRLLIVSQKHLEKYQKVSSDILVRYKQE